MAKSVPGSPAAARWHIRPLGGADLPGCVALALDRGWSAEERSGRYCWRWARGTAWMIRTAGSPALWC
jgi:hypothetical protein